MNLIDEAKRFFDTEDIKGIENEYKKLLKDFQKSFPLKKISKISINDYCIGNGRKDTFCYYLERYTDSLGKIIGANSSKFDIYISSKTHKPSRKKKYKTDTDAIVSIRKELIKLYNGAASNNLAAIDNSVLSNMFKTKIFYLYNPDSMIPVFSERHIDFILYYLGIPFTSAKLTDKRHELLKLKQSIPVFANHSNHLFMKFIYTLPDLAAELHKITRKENAESKIEHIIVDKNINNKKQPIILNARSVGNYTATQQNKTAQGLNVEEMVYKEEIKKHRKYRKLIDHVSKTKGDGLGYDILSVDDRGKPKYIEVKSKLNGSIGKYDFFLTNHEHEKMATTKNYFIYYVIIKNGKYIIEEIDKKYLLSPNLNPVLFRFTNF